MSFLWKEISQEEKTERKKLWDENRGEVDCVKSEPGNVYMPRKFAAIAEKIRTFELRPDDVWLITYPKCGTTWTQELLWNMINGVQPEVSKSTKHSFTRVPFLEVEGLFPAMVSKEGARAKSMKEKGDDFDEDNFNCVFDSIEYAKNLKSPRLIKSHLPISMLNPKLLDTCKVVFCGRNPLDTAVSYFHHQKNANHMYGVADNFDVFAEFYMKGEVMFGDYWYHLKDAWKYKDHQNLKIIWFEDMKKDLMSVIRGLSSFTGYTLSEVDLTKLHAHLDIDSMRNNAKAKLVAQGDAEPEKSFEVKFFRKGQVGDWNNYFKGEEGKKARAWAEEHLRGTGIQITFEH